ncbi:MAG TPA: DUF4097 family beta strand repeat-containing protein [Bacillota bacterium]|nr:DUF4097 family beta strand repeat-containing protein [Bacillota bacterium]
MKKATKIWLIAATSLVVLGLITFVVAMTVNHWDFKKLSTATFETNTYEVSEGFNNIAMKTKTAEIFFAVSDDGRCRVDCYEAEKEKHSVTVENSTLTINIVEERKWYDYIGITIGNPKITVYLPETEYTSLFINESTGDIEIPENFKFQNIDIALSTGNVVNYASVLESLKIKTSTGAVRVEGISANTLDISASTGSVTVSDVTCAGDVKINVSTGKTSITDIKCKNIITSGSTGCISLKNVIVSGKLSVERSTGSVKFDGSDAAEIRVQTSTGSVMGSLLTEKVFITQTDTGIVDVPKTITGGKCEITTNTGDIIIKID